MSNEVDYAEVTTEVTFITPKMAEKLLDLNSHNRNLSNKKVEDYRKLMVGGHWKLNNQGIGVSKSKMLLDGQHRLWAIVLAPEIDKSFKGVHMNITYNLPDDSQMTIDSGLSRKVWDILTLGKRIEDGKKVKAMHIAVARQMSGGLEGRSKQLQLLPEVEVFVKRHWEALDFAINIFPTNVKGVSTAGVRAVIARAYYYAPKSKLQEFAEVLYTGFMTSDNHKGAICLKTWLLGSSFATNSDYYSRQIYGRTAATLKSFLDGKTREKLAVPTTKELFPLPEDSNKAIRSIPQVKKVSTTKLEELVDDDTQIEVKKAPEPSVRTISDLISIGD